YPRYISTRPGQAGDKPAMNRLADYGKDNGDCFSRVFGSLSCGGRGGHDNVDIKIHQLGCEAGKPVSVPPRLSILKGYLSGLNVAKFTEPLAECLLVLVGK